MVHIFLVRVNLINEEFFNELLHLAQCSELKGVFLSVKKDLAGEETPEDLQNKFNLGILL